MNAQEKAFFDKYLTSTPPEGNPYKVGDVVSFKSDSGYHRSEGWKVLGFFKPEYVEHGRTMTLEEHPELGPLPHWFGCRPDNLTANEKKDA